uniref:Uncharacterized protein n=1 Tax=Caenorhabditis japonica TaxID=281687 RepID=A0A8R1IEL0_CAEJA
MFSIPPISEFTSVHYTMAAYVLQGIIITLLNVPLVVLLLYKKQNRDRKEFVLIGEYVGRADNVKSF